MGINFSESIARLRLQHASLNSNNNEESNPVISDDKLSIYKNTLNSFSDSEEAKGTDSFVSSKNQKTETYLFNTKESEEEISVSRYKNAARAAAAMSQYGLNARISLLFKQANPPPK